MSNIKLTKVPFKGTTEQAAKLDKILVEMKKTQGGLMKALQEAQSIYGYLPIEVQEKIADELGISLEEVFGVATFYSLFTLNPKGEYQISVCLGTACYVKGSGNLIAELSKILKVKPGDTTDDGKYSLIETRCVGCCGLAPVLTINDNVYGKLTTKDIAGIIAKYK